MSTGDLQDARLQEALITYEQLQNIEDDFEEVELEIIRQQDKMTKGIYAKRQKIISKIPQFWPLVFEQAPMDVDEYIQPTDSAILLSSLVSLSVDRFELPSGDPRSVSIKFEFQENEYFEDKVIEKKFWWRNANDDWAGLVSEPVDIKWKEGQDPTNGMLGLAKKIWEDEKAGKEGETDNTKKLRELMDNTGLGGISFFAWFGFRGRKISEEEHKEASKKEEEKRKLRKAGKDTGNAMDEDEDEDDDEYELEIFPTGDDLAVCITEDLWPGAIKYFTNANEEGDMSDVDFESDEEMEEDDEKKDEPQNKKKRKA